MSQTGKGMASGYAGESSSDQNPPILPPYYQYGTFQGVASHSSGRPPLPPHHVVGIRHSDSHHHGHGPSGPYHYAPGYQPVPGYAVAEGVPVGDPRLPCCGMGIGWFLFVCGFFFAAIPWYVGAMILLCVRVDYREKPGLVACMIASILAIIAVVFGVSKGADAW